MPFPFDEYPWAKFEDLNIAYMIQRLGAIISEANAKLEELDAWKTATEQDLESWKNSTMDLIAEWEREFMADVHQWEHDTEQDLAQWKIDTIAALDVWKAGFITQYEALRVETEHIRDVANTAAQEAVQAAQDAADSASLVSALFFAKPLPAEYWERIAYASATGDPSASTQRISTKDYLNKSLVTVAPEGNYSFIIFAWDNNDNYVGGWTGSVWATSGVPWLYDEVNLKSLPGNYNIRIMLRQTNNNTIYTSEAIHAVFGFYSDPTLSYEGPAAESSVTAKALTKAEQTSALYDKSRNKFNPENPLISSGYWTSGGKNNASSRVTHPIYVIEGVEYKATHPTSFLGSNNNIAIVDGNGSDLANRLGDFTGTIANGTITFTPSFTGFVSLNIGNIPDEDFAVSESDDYPDLGQSYSPDSRQEKNVLIGKKLSVNGDSICRGQGYDGGYASLIGKRNGMIVQNIAEDGATITYGTHFTNNTDRHWICDTVGEMDSDSDYIIFEGGVNDDAAIIGADKIGSISETNYTGPFDKTTFCGALEYMFQNAYQRFPGKKIGFIICHKVGISLFNSQTTYSTNRYPYVVQACKKWGIPFLDLNAETAPLGYISALKVAYTYNGDGWHPNRDGYLKYYVPQIEAWLKTL